MGSEERSRWSTLARSPVHSGRMRVVRHEVVLPSGARDSFEVDESVPFAVAVLVLDGDELLLAEQYRYPIDRWILDLPGGAGEVGETPEEAARRECEEELGFVPEGLIPLHAFFPNPGRAAWPVHLFLARGTSPGVAAGGDEAEQVRLVSLRVEELDGRIADGVIVDPSLLIARAMAGLLGHLPPLAVHRP